MPKLHRLRDVDPGELVAEYEAGATLAELARRHRLSPGTIRSHIHRAGGRTRTRGEASGFRRRGEQAVGWRGGRTTSSKGYVLVRLQPDHPLWSMAAKSGYVLEHRLVMAQALGRPLRSWEEVHHLDGVRTNNMLANLQLRFRPHGSGIVLRCADCGSTHILGGEL